MMLQRVAKTRPDHRQHLFAARLFVVSPAPSGPRPIELCTRTGPPLSSAFYHFAETNKGTQAGFSAPFASAEQLLVHSGTVLRAVRTADGGAIDIQSNEDWKRVRYMEPRWQGA